MAPRIVVHTDLSETSAAAVPYARTLAESLGATLHFLHVLREPLSAGWTSELSASALPEVQNAMEIEAEQWLDQVLTETEQERFEVSLDIETGDVAEEIARYANENHADLVVLRGPARPDADASDRAVAGDVLAKCRCSVLVVR